MNCTFEKPEDISLLHYMYSGFIYERILPTAEEDARVTAMYVKKYGHGPMAGFKKMPVDRLNEALLTLCVTLMI